MLTTIARICAEIRNYFIRDRRRDIKTGVFVISNGAFVEFPTLFNGQYFRICGSALNDGVYQYPASGFKDEEFCGEIWCMAVPDEIVQLAIDIDKWCEDNAEILNSPFQSESFGGYSYSKGYANSGSGGSSGVLTWQSQFENRLSPYRRLSVL